MMKKILIGLLLIPTASISLANISSLNYSGKDLLDNGKILIAKFSNRESVAKSFCNQKYLKLQSFLSRKNTSRDICSFSGGCYTFLKSGSIQNKCDKDLYHIKRHPVDYLTQKAMIVPAILYALSCENCEVEDAWEGQESTSEIKIRKDIELIQSIQCIDVG